MKFFLFSALFEEHWVIASGNFSEGGEYAAYRFKMARRLASQRLLRFHFWMQGIAMDLQAVSRCLFFCFIALWLTALSISCFVASEVPKVTFSESKPRTIYHLSLKPTTKHSSILKMPFVSFVKPSVWSSTLVNSNTKRQMLCPLLRRYWAACGTCTMHPQKVQKPHILTDKSIPAKNWHKTS